MNAQPEAKQTLTAFTVLERAVLYSRVSYDDRDTDGRNLQGQLDMGREYSQKKDYRVVAELAEDDRGASGAEWDLPKLNHALAMARAGEFEVLIVREIDRFARGLAKQLVVERLFQDAGVRVEYVLGEYPDTPEGNLNKQIKAVIAEYERDKIKERMGRGRELKVKAGSVMVSDKPPFGYRLNDDHTQFVIYEPEARIVRLIFELYTIDGLSTAEIIKKLNELGIPTPSANGLYKSPKQQRKNVWYPSIIQKILSNKTYLGVWHFNKKKKDAASLIEVKVPSIVDPETFEQAKLKREAQRKKHGRGTKRPYLLARRCKCTCGGSVQVHTSIRGEKEYRYYACVAALGKLIRPCDSPYFKAVDLDGVIWQWVKKRMASKGAILELLEEARADREQHIAPLRRRLNTLDTMLVEDKRKRGRWLEMYADGVITKGELVESTAQIDQRVSALEKERALLLPEIEGQTITPQIVDDILRLQAKVEQSLTNADSDFEKRRAVIEALNMQVTLAVEDGQGVAHIRCILGKDSLSILPMTI